MFDMILHFKFIYNLEKLQHDNPNSTSNCAFTPKSIWVPKRTCNK